MVKPAGEVTERQKAEDWRKRWENIFGNKDPREKVSTDGAPSWVFSMLK